MNELDRLKSKIRQCDATILEALHNCNFSDNWCGPDNWRTTGEEWSYEYQINPFGLLKAPILRIKDR